MQQKFEKISQILLNLISYVYMIVCVNQNFVASSEKHD